MYMAQWYKRIQILASGFVYSRLLCHYVYMCVYVYKWTCVYFMKALSTFEYVEPNGKDMGINVRKKVESIVALLNNKEKIQEVRDKASATRDK